MAEYQRRFTSPVHIQHFFSSCLTDSSLETVLYNDTKLVCKDRVIFSNKLLLSLTFPVLEQLLASVGESLEAVIILPDNTADQMNTIISRFLTEPEAEICEQNGSSAHGRIDGKTKHINESIVYTEEVFVMKLDTDEEVKDEMDDVYTDSSQVCLNAGCMMSFLSMKERDHHMMTCTMAILCKFCPEEFETVEEKKRHEESYIASDGQFMCEGKLKQSCQESVLICAFCKETFATEEEMVKHSERHKISEGQIICGFEDCGIVLNSQKSLIKHTRVVHSKQKVRACHFCPSTFLTEDALVRHLGKCNSINLDKPPVKKVRRYVCEFENCGVSLKSKKTLVQHIKMVHIEKRVKIFSCYYCAGTFAGRRAYVTHMAECICGPDGYRCPQKGCDFTSKDERSLIFHFKKHRVGVHDFDCEICGKHYITKERKTRHMKTHTGPYVKPTHKPKVDEQIPCPNCSKIFKCKGYLNTHLNSVHGDPESKVKFKCDQCQKGFSRKDILRAHSLSHIVEQNHPCPTCGKKFTNPRYLHKHVKIHFGVKNFKCSICGKPFLQPDQVRRHELIHTGVMDYSCSICGKAFNQKGNLTTHEKKCAGVILFPIV